MFFSFLRFFVGIVFWIAWFSTAFEWLVNRWFLSAFDKATELSVFFVVLHFHLDYRRSTALQQFLLTFSKLRSFLATR